MRLWKQLFLLILLGGAGFGFFQAYQIYVVPLRGGPPVATAGKPPAAAPAPGTAASGTPKPAAGAPAPGGPPGAQGPTIVVTAAAKEARIQRKVEAVGTTRARQAVEILPLAAGRVVSVAIEPGRLVKAGDILVELDKDIQVADLAEARAKLNEARLALDRAKTLRQSDAISDAQFEQVTSQVAAGQAEVDRADRRLADRVVRAPFAGLTGLNKVEIGQIVSPTTVITTLDDLSEVEVEFAVSEVLFGKVAIGLPVEADAPAFAGRKFNGRISGIDSRVDQTSRSFKVRALIPNEDRALPAGMFMHVTLVLDERDALTVPEEALLVQGGRSYLFAVQDGKATRRPVEVGQRDVGFVEIVSGLSLGERVVTRGVQKLRDGAPVGEAAVQAEPAGTKPSGS